MKTPWGFKTQEFDDWGTIRDVDGEFVCKAMIPYQSEESLNEHRRNGTDPTQEIADLIIRAANRDHLFDEMVRCFEDIDKMPYYTGPIPEDYVPGLLARYTKALDTARDVLAKIRETSRERG